MYRKWNKFFNHMNKSHTEYGPQALFESTPDDSERPDLSLTAKEAHELGLKGNNREFQERTKSALREYLTDHELSCGELAAKLNQDGLRTVGGGPWNSRLVMWFTRRLMNERPSF